MAGNRVALLRKAWHTGRRILSGRSSKNIVNGRSERPGKREVVRAGWLVSGLGRRQQELLSALGNKQKEKPVREERTGLRGKSCSVACGTPRKPGCKDSWGLGTGTINRGMGSG